MRVVITGGLGFLGSFLAESYLEQGHDVVIVDNLSANVVDHVAGARLYTGDCTSWIVSESDPDLIVHCASPVGSVAVLNQAGFIASEILRTTRNVVDAARLSNAAILNVSTSEVYGFSGTYSEADSCIMPPKRSARLEYAAGKLAAEFTVQLTKGVRSLTIRPFNLAGPRQTSAKGFVLPTFIEQARRGEPLTVFGTGRQERAFTAVYDVADWLASLPLDVFNGQWVNVGNPANRTSINDLAARIIRMLDSPSLVNHTTGKQVHGEAFEEAEGVIKLPDDTLARSLGWAPTVDLDALVHRSVRDALSRKVA